MVLTTLKRVGTSLKKGSRPDPQINGGKLIVLTSSRPEMSHFDYSTFKAFCCTFPNKLALKMVSEHLGPDLREDGSSKFAPYGLRKVEAILADRFGADNVVVAHRDTLDQWIGPKTRIIGISTMDPAGLAYVSTTYNSLMGSGEEALNFHEFRSLLDHRAIRESDATVMVGGWGAWQLQEAGIQDELGIDVLFIGQGETELVPFVEKVLNGEEVPKVYNARTTNYNMIPLIKHAAIYGIVEITRGCGRGCHFCSPTMRKKHSFPVEWIMKEVEISIKNGSRGIFTQSEDIFLYKSGERFQPNRLELVRLFDSIARYPGVEIINLSHAAFAPIVYDPKILSELAPILLEKSRWHKNGEKFITVEVGVETGSVRLMKKHMRGKALPYKVDHWQEIVIEGIGNMNDNQWWPLTTWITGTPDETEDDIISTLELFDRLKGTKQFFTPLLFIPLDQTALQRARRPKLDHIKELQWEFLARCWHHNIRFWTPQYKHFFGALLTTYNLVYLRWRLGRNSMVPMMHLAGWPEEVLPTVYTSYRNRCEKELCTPDGFDDDEQGKCWDGDDGLSRPGLGGVKV